MKILVKYFWALLFTGALLHLSCKKENFCENCSVNLPGSTNKSPIANAGPDQTILLPKDSVSIDGSTSSDPDGTISSFQWTKISGPASFTVNNAAAARTVVKNLAAGAYQFELKVTDNGGLSAKDTMMVIVDSTITTNHPPVANAGEDQSITLPVNTINLDGNGSFDPENNIASYAWAKISGPASFNILNSNAVQTQVANLVQGTYQFELKVTDDRGLFSKDTMQVIVNAAGTVNSPPLAKAGPDQTITLPTNTVTLDGSGSTDPDNNITNYAWKKISGPSLFNIANATVVQTQVTSLVQGIYQFELKVTDAGGLFSKDTVQVTVNAAINHPPIANAGPDQTITLPTNTVTLDGSGSTDPDNNIVGYLWTKISGPASFNIVNPNAVITQVTNLAQGIYQFELKVTDAGGLFSKDTMQVTVNPPSTNSHWTSLTSPPGYGTETFITGIDANNVFIGDGFYHNFWKYNNTTNSWTAKASVPGQAYDYLVSFSANGKCYAGMGLDLNTPHSEMYQYDPVVNTWIQKNNSPLSGLATSLVINNLVYLIKNQSVWMYNPITDIYTQKNNFPGNSFPFTRTSFVINGIGFYVNGNECWKYNHSTDTWQQNASLPGNLDVTAAFSLNNYGYVLGDSSRSTYNLNYPLHLWRYDPVPDQWLRIYDDYPGYGAYAIKSVSLNGVVYAGFGYNNGDWPVGDFWKFQ